MIEIVTLDVAQASTEWTEWFSGKRNANNLPDLNYRYKSYVSIRKGIHDFFYKVLKKDNDNKSDYRIDVEFGLFLYEYLHKLGFNMRAYANDGFWRFMSLIVVPDVVGQRWGNDNEDHFWKRSSRIWLSAVWWYVHLSWQGNIEKTKKLLLSPNFTTDSIQSIVERTGREGTYIELYRNIMFFYGNLSPNQLKSNNSENNNYPLLRTIMKIHTAKSMVIKPEIYSGGVEGFARSLFNDAGVSV